ncbi:MAG: DUF4905 domain-containing protein [Bacteroidota bacterium]|nr:DUF4905 domain-containing protein [Bacteroidota bacterium]
MKISTLFRFNGLAPAWQFSATNTLWRIIFSDSKIIVGEDRDTQNKSVTFFCIDAHDGRVLWQKKSFSEKWWIGIEGIAGDRLFLHGFKKPDMPDHQGIICADLKTGIEVWHNNGCSFLTVHFPFVYGYRDLFERRVYRELQASDGTFVQELPQLPENVDSNLPLEKTDFLFPQPLLSENELVWKLIPEDLFRIRSDTKHLEYIELEKYLVFNAYTISQDQEHQENLINTLYIIDVQSRKKLYSDVLNNETPYPVPDSFFVDGNTLYYIKERKTFVALTLEK